MYKRQTWGESHGPAIGCVVDGCPPGISLSEKDIQIDMDRRRPGKSKFTSQRKENDIVHFLSGIFNGLTLGTPIGFLIQNKDAFNLAKLTVGSEGTLVSVTEAKLNLEPIPKVKGLAVLHFTDISSAMEATIATLEQNPDAVEHIGQMIISQARQSLGFSRELTFLDGDPTDILVVEMTGDSESEVHFKLDKLDERINKGVRPYATTRIMRPSDQAKVWAMRQAGLGLMMNIPGDAKPLPFVEDTAVSPEKLPEYVKRLSLIHI